MKIAVLANIGSGSGKSRAAILDIARDWVNEEVFGVKGYGGECLSRCLEAPKAEGYIAGFEAALQRIVREEPDFLTLVGGDGTAAYAADWLIRNGIDLPMFGIGTGTANVGPIITEKPGGKLPDPRKLRERKADALEVQTSDRKHLCYGFNDLVLGNTFLGTKDGQTVTFRASALAAEGRLETAKAAPALGGKLLAAWINGKALDFPFLPAQIILSPLDQKQFYGRAVTGLLCYTPGSPYRAALYMSPRPIVSCEESSAGFDSFLPGAQLLLSERDELTIAGLDKEICAVADGNPYLISDGTVKLKLKAKAARILCRR